MYPNVTTIQNTIDQITLFYGMTIDYITNQYYCFSILASLIANAVSNKPPSKEEDDKGSFSNIPKSIEEGLLKMNLVYQCIL